MPFPCFFSLRARARAYKSLLLVPLSSCSFYPSLLGYAPLPAASSFSFYDPAFHGTNRAALAASQLSVTDSYVRKIPVVVLAPPSHHYRQILANFHWGPFYGPATTATPPPPAATSYEYLRFYANGRFATFFVTAPLDSVQLSRPQDTVGYFKLHGDTIFYQLAYRLAPSTFSTGKIVLAADSLLLMTDPVRQYPTPAPLVYHKNGRAFPPQIRPSR